MPRPKRTRKDSNHAQIRDELRSAGFVVLDVADLPGEPVHNPLDLVILRRDVDEPTVIVATSASGIMRWLEQHPDVAMAQIELKPDVAARFTDNEQAYLESWGLWPPEIWQ